MLPPPAGVLQRTLTDTAKEFYIQLKTGIKGSSKYVAKPQERR
jgi:hypothetical protein